MTTHAGARRCAMLIGLSIAAAALCAPAQAQSRRGPNVGSQAASWSIFGGFTAYNLASPGLHLGAEYPLAIMPPFRSLLSVSFQLYHQENTQTGYALQARWGQRVTAGFGLTFDAYLGLGLQLTDYDRTVFEFEDSVAVTTEQSELRVGFAPHVVFGPGYDFFELLQVPLHVYLRPGVMLLYPDANLAYQVAAIVELGLRWTF